MYEDDDEYYLKSQDKYLNWHGHCPQTTFDILKTHLFDKISIRKSIENNTSFGCKYVRQASLLSWGISEKIPGNTRQALADHPQYKPKLRHLFVLCCYAITLQWRIFC